MAHAKTSRKTPRIPPLIIWLFAAAALFLIPWAMWLSYNLPVYHLDQSWNVAWGGIDVGEFTSLALAAYLGWRKSGWVIVAAAAAGALLLVDAWFDTLTAHIGWEYVSSLGSALFIELPLSILAFWVAYREGKRYF